MADCWLCDNYEFHSELLTMGVRNVKGELAKFRRSETVCLAGIPNDKKPSGRCEFFSLNEEKGKELEHFRDRVV